MLLVSAPAAGERYGGNDVVEPVQTDGGGVPWSADRLLDRTRCMAADVAPWPGRVPLLQRQYRLVERTIEYELWVIYWPAAVDLLLHDHGGSAGAFQVIDGVLEETSTTLRKRRLRRRLLKSGQGKSFGPEYVHSIVNPETAPATSIHAYSPPLTSMRFYSHSPSGLIVSQVVTNWDGAPPD
jgi:Cysteine dioxygenase type I